MDLFTFIILVLILCVYLGLHEHNTGGATGAFLLGYLLFDRLRDTFAEAV